MTPDDMTRAYTELAVAILVWNRANENGVRADVVEAEKALVRYAVALQEAGWKLVGVPNGTP